MDQTQRFQSLISKNVSLSTHPSHTYDIVIGPVADDTIATLFRNFDDGVIDIQMLVHGLKFKRVTSQYFFHSIKSISYLKLLES